MKLSRRTLLGVGGCLALPAAASGREPSLAPELSGWIAETMQAENAPGLAAVVVRGGTALALFTHGRASLGYDAPVSGETLFHVGSIGKHITAVAALRLVEAGKLSLDDPVGRHAPALPAHLADRPFRTLLNHTSGFPNYAERIEWDRPFGRTKFFDLIRSYPAEFPAGTAWSYSNSAYVLIGYIIEDLAGKNYARIVMDDLFRPHGLRNGRVDDAGTPVPLRAEPYTWEKERYVHAVRMSGEVSSVAAGGILMSMRDVAPWVQALHRGSMLSPSRMAAMTTPVRLHTGREIPYGFGWMLDRMPDRSPLLYHGGSVPGFRAMHIHIPRHDLSVLVAANSDTQAPGIVGWRLAEHFAPGSTPLSLAPIPDAAPTLTRAARAIVTRSAAVLEPAGFAPELALHLIAGRDDIVPRLPVGQANALGEFGLVQEDPLGDGARRRRYRARFPGYVRHIDFHHLEDGRIYFVRIQ